MSPFLGSDGGRLDVVMRGTPERRPGLVGQHVGFHTRNRLESRRIYSTRWVAGRQPEVSFGPDEPHHPADKVVIHRHWGMLPRDSIRRFLESRGMAPAEAEAAAIAARKPGDPAARDLADTATAADTPAGPAIPPCGTCDHEPIRLFIELAMAVETGAPAWFSNQSARRLARYGYRVELIAPADDAPEPREDWHWLLRNGRCVSGLPLGTAGMTGNPESAAGGSDLPIPPDSATFEREKAATLAGPGPFVDPSPQPLPPSPAEAMTPLGPVAQRTPQ